jgi:hypothetical protein
MIPLEVFLLKKSLCDPPPPDLFLLSYLLLMVE